MKLTTESYSPQHPALTNPQSVFFSRHDTKFHTHTKWQEQWQLYGWVHATFWTEW